MCSCLCLVHLEPMIRVKIQWNICLFYMLLEKNDPLELFENCSFILVWESLSFLGVLCSNIWPSVAVTHGDVCYPIQFLWRIHLSPFSCFSPLCCLRHHFVSSDALSSHVNIVSLCSLACSSHFLPLAVWSFHQGDHGLSTCPCMVDIAQGPPAVYYASVNLKSLMEVIFCFVTGFWSCRQYVWQSCLGQILSSCAI